MQHSHIISAAKFLISRRKDSNINSRLNTELRPSTTDEAIAIQTQLIANMGDTVGGWKCVLPADDKINIGAIFSKTIHRSSPCPIKLDSDICRIEPEIAFCFKHDLPARDAEYSEDEVIDALDSAHLVLEFIHNRYSGTEEVSYLENLADCLFNQGMFVGPEITLDSAISSPHIDFVLSQEAQTTFSGTHPNKGPLLPVLWLVNYLRQQGMGIAAGQIVTTGSYAGVLEVKPNLEFTIEYAGIGAMSLTLTPQV